MNYKALERLKNIKKINAIKNLAPYITITPGLASILAVLEFYPLDKDNLNYTNLVEISFLLLSSGIFTIYSSTKGNLVIDKYIKYKENNFSNYDEFIMSEYSETLNNNFVRKKTNANILNRVK